MKSRVDIYQYTDFRLYLKDAFAVLKREDRKYSQRFILQKLGLKSSGWLADMLGGRKKLHGSQILRLSQLLSLSARQELYFETLVQYTQSKSIEEKNRSYEKLLTFHEIPRDIIGRDRFEYFSKWYYSAIRELLIIRPFCGDYAELSRCLQPTIGVPQARKAIALLEKLGFLQRFASGEYRPVVEHVKMQSTFGPVYYYNYIKTNVELGKEAVERFPKEERDVSAVAITLSSAGFEEVKDDIRALRKKIITLSEAENKKFWDLVQGDSRRVYQCMFQLFPMSKRSEKIS